VTFKQRGGTNCDVGGTVSPPGKREKALNGEKRGGVRLETKEVFWVFHPEASSLEKEKHKHASRKQTQGGVGVLWVCRKVVFCNKQAKRMHKHIGIRIPKTECVGKLVWVVLSPSQRLGKKGAPLSGKKGKGPV